MKCRVSHAPPHPPEPRGASPLNPNEVLVKENANTEPGRRSNACFDLPCAHVTQGPKAKTLSRCFEHPENADTCRRSVQQWHILTRSAYFQKKYFQVFSTGLALVALGATLGSSTPYHHLRWVTKITNK